jgi:hypothetical protein
MAGGGLSENVNGFLGPGEAVPTEETKGRVAFEELMFTLQCVGRFAFSRQTVHKRDAFMDDLASSVQAVIWRMAAFDIEEGRFGRFFSDEYNARADEYEQYRWETDAGQSLRNTLPWEYGKKLLTLIAPSKDALRVTMFGTLALRSVERLIPIVQEVIENYG